MNATSPKPLVFMNARCGSGSTTRETTAPRRSYAMNVDASMEKEGRKLTATQEKQVSGLIADKLPEQLRLSFALWTRKAMAELLEQQFGLKLPVRTMGLYLKRWGFTPQKPIKKAYEQNPKK